MKFYRTTFALAGTFLALTTACSKKEEANKPGEPATLTSSALPTPPLSGRAAEEAAIRAVVNQWNHALADHQGEVLTSVYAAKVNAYGHTSTREQLVGVKDRTIKTSPGYTQSIGAVSIDWADEATPVAAFEKKWTSHGAQKSVQSILGFTKESGKWFIERESDVATEKRATMAQATANMLAQCDRAIEELVGSTAEAKAMTKTGAGLIVAPEREESGSTVDVLVTEEHPDHRVTLGSFEVDLFDLTVHKVNVAEGGTIGAALAVDPAKKAAAQKICPWE